MDIKEKQAIWLKEKPLFEAKLIHSHLLQFFNFNENTGDYEIKNESVNHTDDEDRKVAYESLNTGWAMWLRAKNDAKAQVVPKINGSIQAHELTISEIKAEIEEGYDLCQDIHLLDALVERGIQIGKILAVPEGFVLVPRVITDEWMAVYIDPAVSNYCKDYEDLPFSVEDSELPEIRESHRLPIRNAHKRLMQVIEAQEQKG